MNLFPFNVEQVSPNGMSTEKVQYTNGELQEEERYVSDTIGTIVLMCPTH